MSESLDRRFLFLLYTTPSMHTRWHLARAHQLWLMQVTPMLKLLFDIDVYAIVFGTLSKKKKEEEVGRAYNLFSSKSLYMDKSALACFFML